VFVFTRGTKSVSIRLECLLISLAAVLLLSGCKQEKVVQSTSGPPPVPVSVANATEEAIPFEVRVVGNVEASSIVQVKSQVAGPLDKVYFTEGQNVAKGALLFEIDPRPFQEALRQAEAAANRDRAQLQQAEATMARESAQAKNADAEAKRYDELAKAGVISKSQHEQVATSASVSREAVRAAEAGIASSRAALESDLAAIDRAKLDLSYCQIRSPISGRTGNLLVHAGNLVKANDVPLVVINQVTPIFVTFSVPEQYLAVIRQRSARQKLGVKVTPHDVPGRSVTGYLSVVDNTVDTGTGGIKLKATFDNRDALLWPGQFVDVALVLDTIQNATVVPSEAVQAGQKGSFVYYVKKDQTVEPRIVQTGRIVGPKTVIENGVAPGDTIVTDGHLRLFPGARIRPVDLNKLESGKS
jgi:membrane fusion protein, multidrug efflux system